MSIKYNDVVALSREVARDGLRMSSVNGVRQTIMAHNTEIQRLENSILNVGKDIARETFRISQLNENDPDFESKKKSSEDSIAFYEKNIQAYRTRIEQEKEAIKKEEERIEKIQNGEEKVSAEMLFDSAEALLGEITRNYAVEKAKELQA